MEIFERVEVVLKIKGHSRHSLAKRLGVAQVTFNRYFNKENQDKLSTHLWSILQVFPDVRRDWLFFDEGQPFSDTAPLGETPTPPPAPVSAPPELVMPPVHAPLRGFASCGLDGWSGTMTFTMAVPMPCPRPDMFAVTASGDSMIPAGIGNGHICFCDPHATPIPGESVYVELRDKQAALKVFLGREERSGGAYVLLRGWHDKDGNRPQKDFILHQLELLVNMVAPVVYVQRRL